MEQVQIWGAGATNESGRGVIDATATRKRKPAASAVGHVALGAMALSAAIITGVGVGSRTAASAAVSPTGPCSGSPVTVQPVGAGGDDWPNLSKAVATVSAFNQASPAPAVPEYVALASGTYTLHRQLNLPSSVNICGAGSSGARQTTFHDSGALGVFGMQGVSSSGIYNLVIDLQGQQAAGIHISGLSTGCPQLTVARNDTVSSVVVENVTNSWGIDVGTPCASLPSVAVSGLTLTGDSFWGFNTSFEEVLLFNTNNATVTHNYFGSAANHSSGAGLGLYQNDDQIMIADNVFDTYDPATKSANRGSYYSQSVNDVSYVDNTFELTPGQTASDFIGIQGANESDHGLFGSSLQARNYLFKGNVFQGLEVGLEAGDLAGASIVGNTFTSDWIGVRITGGRLYFPIAAGVQVDTNLVLSGNTFAGNVLPTKAELPTTIQGVLFTPRGLTSVSAIPTNTIKG